VVDLEAKRAHDVEVELGEQVVDGVMITTTNEPGALYRVLERFYALNINLIKLESRPIPGHNFEFMFYFDLDCPFGSKALDDLLDSIDDVCESFTYFGSYTEVL